MTPRNFFKKRTKKKTNPLKISNKLFMKKFQNNKNKIT